MYFPWTMKVKKDPEATDVLEEGDVAYWITDAKSGSGCICVGFGPTENSKAGEIRLKSRCNVFGKVDNPGVLQSLMTLVHDEAAVPENPPSVFLKMEFPRTLQLRFNTGDSFVAELYNTNTAAAVASSFAPDDKPVHFESFGDLVYFPVGGGNEIMAEEEQKSVCEPGELAYWIEGGSLCIGFGPTQLSVAGEIRLSAPCNVFGRIISPPDFVDRLRAVQSSASTVQLIPNRRRVRLRDKDNGMVLSGELYDNKVADALWEQLPVSAAAQSFGKMLYFSCSSDSAKEISETLPNARLELIPGELAYWSSGDSICIGWGPTHASVGSEIRLTSLCSVFGRIYSSLSALDNVDDSTVLTLECDPTSLPSVESATISSEPKASSDSAEVKKEKKSKKRKRERKKAVTPSLSGAAEKGSPSALPSLSLSFSGLASGKIHVKGADVKKREKEKPVNSRVRLSLGDAESGSVVIDGELDASARATAQILSLLPLSSFVQTLQGMVIIQMPDLPASDAVTNRVRDLKDVVQPADVCLWVDHQSGFCALIVPFGTTFFSKKGKNEIRLAEKCSVVGRLLGSATVLLENAAAGTNVHLDLIE